MDLSLRDLAERSGVSAPMLSQVERGETSPTLAVAARIAAGLDLSLSQLLRLDEDGHVVVVRRGQGRKRRRGGHRVEELTPPLPGQRADVSLHRLGPGAVTGGRGRPADPRAREPRDGGGPGGHARPWPSTASVTSCEPATASPSTPTSRITSRTTGSSRPSSSPSWRRASAGADDAEDHVRQDLGRPRGRRRPDLRRPAPGPRGHLAAGLRRAAARGPQGAPPRQDGRHRRPQRAHRRHAGRAPDRRRALPSPGRDPGAQLRRVRDPGLLAGLRSPGDRARDRSRAGADPAGPDDRLRRQPHRHSRRLRSARRRHRHLRGRARAGHPVPGLRSARRRCGSTTPASSATGSPPRT